VKACGSLPNLGEVSEYFGAEIATAARGCSVTFVFSRLSRDNGRRLIGARCKGKER